MAEEEDRKETKKRRTSNTPYPVETLKERQARVILEKESRRGLITQVHKYFIDYAGYHLDIDTGVIEDDILESQLYINFIDDFIQGRSRKVLFFYQEVPEGAFLADLGKPKTKKFRHIIVTDGWETDCNGRCVFFVSVKPNIVLNPKNVGDEVYFGFMDLTEEKSSLLKDMERLFRGVYRSALGDSEAFKKATAKVERRLLSVIDTFIMFLASSSTNLSNQVVLQSTPILDEIEALQSQEECFDFAANSDNIAAVEKLVWIWYKQIQKVLAETEQIRREPDDVGPLAEVDYWRNLASVFCSLIDQAKSPKISNTLLVLKTGNSKLIKSWSEIDLKLRDFATEAKDNLVYLFPVEKACESLYNSTPESMMETIPNLLNVARLINSVSRYYNNPERLSALFIKVTSQLVTGCKRYVSQDGLVSIWDYPLHELKERLQMCLQVYKAYQVQFERAQKIIDETPGERQFGFSQMFIFGKFTAFMKRVNKLLELVEILERFELIGKCGIEGIEQLLRQFDMHFTNLKRKQYDFLDDRKKDFNYDYEDFKKNIRDIEDLLAKFMDATVAKMSTAVETLKVLKRFENLRMPSLNVKDKYQVVLRMIGEELETIKKTYEKDKDDPAIPRGSPPAAGRVMWSRHLFKKMQEPIMTLQTESNLLQTKEGKKLVKMYNAIGKALVQFEMAFHELWMSQVDNVKIGLESPLLVLHPESREVFINYDPFITQTIREGQCFAKLGLEVVEEAKTLIYRQAVIRETYILIKGLVEEIEKLKEMIPAGFRNLMELSMTKLEAALLPGFTIMTWSSISLEKFFTEVRSVMAVIERFLKQVNDLKSARIDDEFIKIKSTLMVDFPEYESISVDEFLRSTQQRCEVCANELDARTHKAEEAVNELIKMVLLESGTPILYVGEAPIWAMPAVVKKADDEEEEGEKEEPLSPEMEQIIEECRNLFNFFRNKNMDALVQGTRDSLDAIRKRVQSANLVGTKRAPRKKRKDDYEAYPLFQADIALVLPNLVLQPNVEDIQLSVNKAATMILDVGKKVSVWGHEAKKKLDSISEAEVLEKGVKPRNVYKAIVDHKETSKVMMMLSTCVLEIRTDIGEIVQSHSIYDFLYMRNREEIIQDFVSKEPTLNEFKEEILRYEGLETEIQKLPAVYRVGAVDLNSGPIKLALTVEAKAWKVQLGRQLHQKYKVKMLEINNFLNENLKKLARPIKDLEDVRSAMACLEDIRENYLRIDMDLTPIEEAYGLLQRFQMPVSKDEIDTVDTLRYNFQRITEQSNKVQDELMVVQPTFEKNLQVVVANFTQNLKTLSEDYETAGPMEEGIPPREASDRMAVFEARFDDMWNKYETCSGGEELFGLEVHDYPHIHKMKRELSLLQKLYGLYNEVNDTVETFGDTLWSDFDADKINSALADFQVKCKKLPKGLKEWQAFVEMKKKIDDLNETVPLLELMANKAMKPRHWRRLEELTGFTFDILSEAFQIKNIICAPLLKYKDEVEDICVSAVKEKDIEAKLKQIIFDWSNKNLTFATFKSRGEVLLKAGDIVEIIAQMEDSLMVLGSLLTNRYNAPFKKDIQLWVNKLSNSIEIMNDWITTQNLWIYLEAVFVGGDISKQLPKEAKRFQNIDKSWIKIMARAHEIPNVLACCVGDETLAQLLPHMLEQLEACQKSLTGYLETKRLVFPRFFFISDPALLEILGQASDCHLIQPHLAGVFENVNELEFHDKEYERVIAYKSREKERIPMEVPMLAKGNVEIWLGTLLDLHCRSLNKVIREGYHNINSAQFDLIMFLDNSAAQVGLLGVQMIWTRDSEIALNNAKTDRKIMNTTNNKWLELLNTLIDQTTKELLKFERVKYETLITIHVHQRDIFDDLVKAKVKSILDFEWQKQARFYYDEEVNNEIVKITDVNFLYQNEYMGCTDRLVITPLTDRCYITLAQAMSMSMGGAPAGPAGTGKTETTKDMGKALGKYVVVFNCSDQMDFRGLGRIYKGLAQSGSWGCFDEFNRIDLPVLSVAAQQIYIVLLAKKEKKPMFIFSDGDVVPMNPEFGLFITMNPGYAGRQELPENLKVLFRTVSMMVPDRQIIKRVKLASCGFGENVVLSQKFYTLYKLCEEQLTKQVHYDFGLRNILSVLRTMGAAKRARPNESEAMVAMRILRDMNLSKLVDEDEPLFRSLISDLFPGIALENATYPELQTAIANQVEAQGLINHPPWNLKVIQLFEQQRVRHGFMTIGPSGAGKSCCINTLMRSLTETGEPTKENRMNPKAITAPQMFGRLDVATNDWTDGIFSVLWRRSHKAKKGEHIWIVLDGPVDAIWIENLNSVLDDNKCLTLANGDRIPMAPNCKVVFEPDNIDNASPATVSRNGMVYMSSSFLDWRPILKAWLITRPQNEAQTYQELYDKSFDEACRYVLTTLWPKMKILECNYIKQSIDLLEGLMMEKTDNTPFQKPHLERFYVFAVMWSLGSLLELDDRAKLETFLKKHPSKLPLPKVPAGQNIFEYVIDKAGNWEHWNNRVQEYIYPADEVPEYTSILIPNVDNVRTNYLIDLIARQTKAVMLIGEQGTAKTVMINSYMAKYDPEFHLSKVMNLSSTTVPIMVQRTIESYVDKRMGTTYGPPSNRKMTVFIDDINMPIINEWGDQVCNEITRQLMECKGFYNLEKPGEFTNIVDMQFLAATIHPGGGRNDVPPRLKRQFSIFNCTFPSNTSIDKIFSVIGCGYFNHVRFDEVIINCIKHLIPSTRILWQQTKVKLLPTPTKFHYAFNLRDLSRIWQGMLMIMREECNTVSTILGLWRHECTRVIADRFTNPEDLKWFNDALRKIIRNDLGEEYWEMMPSEPYFADFLRIPLEDEDEEGGGEEEEAVPKVYEMVPGFDFLNKVLSKCCRKYNSLIKGAKMSLVFFKDCMTHFLKISRIIRTPKGHALLVGVGGSGKQSLTRLASFVAGYTTFQIVLSRTYSANNLIDDLKNLYRLAGLKGLGTTFLFTDNEIKDEGFLEYLNNMLSGGEPSSLFAKDELDEICGELVGAMKREFPKVPPTNDALYEFFVSRSKTNLHVVLCFSPVGDKFRSRSLKFPGLISGCTMDWFSKWPRDALVAVAEHFLGKFNIITTPVMKAELMNSMGIVHEQVEEACANYLSRFRRTVFVTPKSYLSFIDDYMSLYKEKYELVGDVAYRMNMGLEKLIEATESVNVLSKELEVKEKELLIASVKVDKVLEEVTKSAGAATVVKNEVQKVKDKAQKIVDGIAVEKELAEAKLEAAKPAMADAEAALLTIKAADIATVRKLGKPPHLIMRIMDCVLLLFQKKLDPPVPDPERPCPKPSWGEALKLMSGTGFLSMLQNFNKDTINEEVVELMSPYLEMEDYNFATAMKVCAQVSGLLSWTIAMAVFFGINKEVLPLKANLIVQEARLTAAMTELNSAQAQLDEKQGELDKVQATYDGAMKEKQELLDDAEMCKYKMKTASALINGLSGEKARWTEQSKTFKDIIDKLIGDVLVLAGFLSYCGPFNQEYRTLMVKGWQKEMKKRDVLFTAQLNFIESLTDPPTIGEWSLQGLPNDDLSVQNGIITTKSSRYPLLIDPQAQGKLWISNREKQNDLMTTNLLHKYFRTHLEDALSNGRPLLIEDIGEELDPCLDHILEKNFVKGPGGVFKIKVGDKECESITGFTLFMTTKLPNPKYSPEIYAKVSTIDFTVTMKGLEDQLLGRVIQMEKPELELEKKKLLETVTAYKRRMQELEENLLYKLTSTQGSLVEDVSLISVLAITKETAAEVKEKLAIAAETEIKTNLSREEFRPVASRGSQLYFLICEMSMVNVMYQTSLKQFLKIFDFSLLKSDKSPVTAKRIKFIIEFMTFEMFKFSCRALYEKDKFLFTMLLTLRIDMQKGFVKYDEFQILIKGGAALDLNSILPKPCKWITDVTWMNLVELSKLPQFTDITVQIPRNEKQWRAWFDKDAPEEETIPDGYSTSLDVYRKLLLVRCWCPDRTIAQARKYIADSMGKKYADPVILNLEQLHSESDPRTPMICFLSMGSDPTAMIYGLAIRYGLGFEAISMGQGQEIHARRIVGQFSLVGGWVLLQNCHLGLEYTVELLDYLTVTETIHNDFRVWITTDVHPLFPISVLQASLKFTSEPPQGLKAGLKRTFIEMKQDHLDYTDYMQWKPMLYMMSFLHSTVQERRKYGPLGWNIPYEFNSADYTSSVQFIMNHLDDMDPKRGVSWITVRYMIAEVQYGGRVTDDYDKRLLNTYAKVWFSEAMVKEDFVIYKDYKVVKCDTVDKYLATIEELPDVDTPLVFGLHSNADITYQTNMAQSLLDTISSIQPKESGGGEGETRESVVFRMADDMLERLPRNYLPHEIRARIDKMGNLNSLNIFLKQEVDRMQKVINVVRVTCTDLKLAIEGTIIMSENLKNALDKMFDAKVPDTWLKISWISVSIGFWFTEFLDRNTQFWNWLFIGRPVCFWLTGFFNPQGFLTSMRQEVTRMHKGWALDTVALHNEVTKYFKEELNNQPAEGVYVYGLFLDGASWDRKNCRLQDSAPKVLFTAVPVIHVYAINSTAPKDPKLYMCPVYKKPQRTDLMFITPLWLKTALSPDFWILRGVALLCDVK